MPGGNGGSSFSDKGNKVLKRVCLRVDSSGLRSIQSVYTDESTGTKYGGNGGISHWFDLDEGDYTYLLPQHNDTLLCSLARDLWMKKSYALTTQLFPIVLKKAVFLWANTAVRAIQFQTNHGRVSQKYGSGEGAPFVLGQKQAGETQIAVGFNGRASSCIYQLDVIWSEDISPKHRYIKTTELRGTNATGEKFNDMLYLRNPRTAAVSRIVIRHCCVIDSIKVYYTLDNAEGSVHGGTGGRRDEFTLESDEFIKKIEGRSHSGIAQLTFVTNKRRWGPYGSAEGEPFIWDASEGVPAHLESRMGLLSFSGSSDKYLDQLQATFAEYSPVQDRLGSVKYEGHIYLKAPPSGMQAGDDDTAPVAPALVSEQMEDAVPLSKFSLHLMAPIITLRVGPDRIEFHAYEDTLCQLPFFRAALQGQFREASERTICMPEDYPSQLSALIEFLCTGNYTYTYEVRGVLPQEASKAPARNLTEGLFHLSVYAIATKYNFQGLIDMSLKSFKAVLDVLDEIDTLRLWKAAYAEGIRIPGQKSDTGRDSYDEKTIIWVSQLFQKHCEEVETAMSECPQLSCDLLRLATARYWG